MRVDPTDRARDEPAGAAVAAVDLARVDGAGGVVWSVSPGGFHTNLVVLDAGGAIAPHRNDAVDVLVVVLAGTGTAAVDGRQVDLAPATALLLPRRSVRAITAGSGGLRYLTVHGERAPLMIARPRHDDV